MSQRLLLAFVLGFVVVAATQDIAAVTIVQDGEPRATIVVREAVLESAPYRPDRYDAGSPEQKVHLAAFDLQHYVEKITGAKLPIVSDKEEFHRPAILVGASEQTERLGVKIPDGFTADRREEEYMILCRDNTLVLAGNDLAHYHGTPYAVYEFLNRLGVRWFMPSDFGEVVPSLKTIRVDEIDFRDKPDFAIRNWWLHATPKMYAEEHLWKLRNKAGPVSSVKIPGDGSINQYLPHDQFDEHPEWFAMNADSTPIKSMPSLSHPDVPALVAKAMKKRLAERLERDDLAPLSGSIMRSGPAGQHLSIGLAPSDGLPVDFSPETMKLNRGFAGILGRAGVPKELSISEEWFQFINKVAQEVTKDYPDVIISTNGYANRDLPPEGISLHPNLSVMYAAIWADTLHAFDNPRSWHGALQGHIIERWCELNKRVFIYNYNEVNLVSLQTPVPTVRKLAHNLPLLKKWGLMGFMDEARNAYMEHGITTRYTRARIYWNANLDVNALLGDYFQKWYGKAAAPAQAFWEALDDCIENTPILGHEDRILPYVYTPSLLETLERHVADAERLAHTERTRLHVRVDRHILEHLKAYMTMHDAEFAAQYEEAVRHADTMAEHRVALHEISPFFTTPESTDPDKVNLSVAYFWNLALRRAHYQKLHGMTAGKTGQLVAMAPKKVKFSLDEANMGKILQWHAPAYDRSQWRTIDVTQPYYTQGYMDERGVPYQGLMWYVFELDVPETASGGPVHVYAPIVNTEAWVWVNGQYIGHRKYLDAYWRPAPLHFDVTDSIRPGTRNIVAVRVSTGMNRTQAPDGFQGRLFLYAPIAEVVP